MKLKVILILISIIILLGFFYIKYSKSTNKENKKINKKINNLNFFNKKIAVAILGKQTNIKQTLFDIIEKAASPLRLHFFIITQNTNLQNEIFDNTNLNISVTTFSKQNVNYKTSYNLFLKRIPSFQFNCILFLNPKFIKLKKNFDIDLFKHNSNKTNSIFTGNSSCYYTLKNGIVPYFESNKLIQKEVIPIFAINPYFYFMTPQTFKSLPAMRFSVDKYILQLYLTQQFLENDFTFYSNQVKYDNLFIHNKNKDKLLKSLQKLKKHNFKLNTDVFSKLGLIISDERVMILSNGRLGCFDKEPRSHTTMKHGSLLQYKNKVLELET